LAKIPWKGREKEKLRGKKRECMNRNSKERENLHLEKGGTREKINQKDKLVITHGHR